MGVLRVFLIWIALAIPISVLGANLTLRTGEEHTFSLEGAVPGESVTCYWELDGIELDTKASSVTLKWDEEGLYYLSARYEKNGCGSKLVTVEIEVIEAINMPDVIPDKFFSPDGDGVNERWWIKNIEYYPNSIIEIYDRFSKLLVKYKGIDFIDLKGWDGIYNGHPVRSDDYWYYIRDILPNKPKSGHFILKRGNK